MLTKLMMLHVGDKIDVGNIIHLVNINLITYM
jgi:hypothetical protein